MSPTPDSLKLIHQKTETLLCEIAAGTRGALGFMALDPATGEQFALNEHTLFPQASAIKIPILMEVFKQAHEGRFNLTDNRRVEKTDKTPGSGILWEMGDTVQMSLHDVCVLMIVLSDNTATNLLIDLVGKDNVNRTLQWLGLKQTRLQRRMMDLDSMKRGYENVSTPHEAARIMELLYRGEFINRAICDEILAILKKPKNTNISSGLPPGTVVAGKPGGISGVTTEWAIVLLNEKPYILTVMENFSAGQEAPSAIKEISRTLHDHFSRLAHATPHGIYMPACPT